MAIKLLILHTHQLICQTLATHLQPLGYDVRFCSTTLDDAIDLARQFLPDLVLADVDFEEGHGFESVRVMQQLNPRTRTLLALPPDGIHLPKALQTDASGYLPQEFELPELETCLQTVLDCFRYVSPTFAAPLHFPSSKPDEKIIALLDSLSVRRKQVLVLVCQGLRIKEVANQLHMSPETVKSNKKFIATELGLPGRRDIVFFMASYRRWLDAHAHLVENIPK